MHIHTLTDIQIPELQPFRTLRRSREQFAKGLFIAEGEKVVTRLLASGLRVQRVLLSDGWLERKRTELESVHPHPEVFVGPKEILNDVVGYNLHQGIMALAEVPPQQEISVIRGMGSGPQLFLAIDDLTNAENVGIIVRNARAFGVSCIIVGETSSSPYLRRAVRNSLGAVFSVPVHHTTDLASTLASLRSGTLSIIAAETRKGGVPLDDVGFLGNVCLVVGGEDKGIRQPVLDVCDRIVEIPMVEGMDSVNVANATAICLYEVRRQRGR